MDLPKPIIFYDIASGPPVTCWFPNPWKTRYALNFKGVHYQTEWVERPDVPSVRKKFNLDPNATFWDGSPFYTLPIIQNLATSEVIGDSFDIALYLEKTYANTPSLFPPSTVGLQAAFNKQIDAIFGPFTLLCVYNNRLNPDTAEETRAFYVWRTQKEKWEDLNIQGEKRAQMLEEFKAALGELAKAYSCVEGLFLGGEMPLYADLVIGAWLTYLKLTLKEWEDIQTWHDSLWGKIHLALEKYAEVK